MIMVDQKLRRKLIIWRSLLSIKKIILAFPKCNLANRKIVFPIHEAQLCMTQTQFRFGKLLSGGAKPEFGMNQL